MYYLTCTKRDLRDAIGTVQSPGALLYLGRKDIPNATGVYALSKAIRVAQEEAKHIEAARMALVTQYGEKDTDGTLIATNNIIKLLDVDGFNTDFNALLDESVTLTGVRAITMAELDGATEIVQVDGKTMVIHGVSGNALAAAGPFVTE